MTRHPEPTGRLPRTDTGVDLELRRTFRAPIEDVWASVTESDRTARWYGSWEGEGREGGTIRVTMGFEENSPVSDMTIVGCRAPHHVAVESGGWHFEITLAQTDDVTTLTFVHHLESEEGLGDIGPGWEYYLDMLVAARQDGQLPSFDDYYPSQSAYYLSL